MDGEDADHGFLDDQQLLVVLRMAVDQPDVAPGIARKQEAGLHKLPVSSIQQHFIQPTKRGGGIH